MEQQTSAPGPPVIAVVEDDPYILDALQLVLEAHGWEARTFLTGEEFLADFCSRPECDCLLLDPHLPGIDGGKVAESVAPSGVPILVITARPDSTLTRTLVEQGARGVITKPVGEAELVARIAALLSQRVGG